jgi:hypothetical protein
MCKITEPHKEKARARYGLQRHIREEEENVKEIGFYGIPDFTAQWMKEMSLSNLGVLYTS